MTCTLRFKGSFVKNDFFPFLLESVGETNALTPIPTPLLSMDTEYWVVVAHYIVRLYLTLLIMDSHNSPMT